MLGLDPFQGVNCYVQGPPESWVCPLCWGHSHRETARTSAKDTLSPFQEGAFKNPGVSSRISMLQLCVCGILEEVSRDRRASPGFPVLRPSVWVSFVPLSPASVLLFFSGLGPLLSIARASGVKPPVGPAPRLCRMVVDCSMMLPNSFLKTCSSSALSSSWKPYFISCKLLLFDLFMPIPLKLINGLVASKRVSC